MGLLYMLILDYPKYTFEVIQRLLVLIGLDSCTPRVHTLKKYFLSFCHLSIAQYIKGEINV